MKLHHVLLVAALALVVLSVGCKSKDTQVAEALQEKVLAPLETAKKANDITEIAKNCAVMVELQKNAEIKEQLDAKGEAAKVAQKIADLCKDAPSLMDAAMHEATKGTAKKAPKKTHDGK